MSEQDGTSRSLTQGEIDGYNRHDFVKSVLAELEAHRPVRFLAIKKHHTLVEFNQRTSGEWAFSIGVKHWYTYHYADVIKALEELYDGANLVALAGEFQIRANHQTANVDAENITLAPVHPVHHQGDDFDEFDNGKCGPDEK